MNNERAQSGPPSEDELPTTTSLPGHRKYLIYCDESGIDGQIYYGFGSLWIPQERRGDLTGAVGALRARHRHYDEIKWSKINRRGVSFYQDLITEFFSRRWLMFHCILIRKGYVDRRQHRDYDEARRKHFSMLIKSKVKFFSAGSRDKEYHVRVDPLPSRYKKADEAALKIVGASLKKELGINSLGSLHTVDSKSSVGVQLADVLLGAAISEWQGRETGDHKRTIRQHVAEHLGWPDMRADTSLSEWKFNIWYFYNPSSGSVREATTRTVRLKIPMPKRRPRQK